MNSRLAVFFVAIAILIPASTRAQSSTLTGTVVDDLGETLIGAQVSFEALTLGTVSDIDGRYRFEVPQSIGGGQTLTLTARYVGFLTVERSVTLTPGEQVQDFVLARDLLKLDEIVVTGVASGTRTRNLGFSIGKVSGDALEAVPSVDAANALRGKVAGVTIVQASGDPSSPADIRLRGSTSITGEQQPLIILDGVITDGNLRDLSMEDVESIEVVKGAAAASIYGSLAGNGVIQIRTRRGAASGIGLQAKVRSEFGFSRIASSYPIATRHPFLLDELTIRLPDGTERALSNPTEAELDALPSGSRVLAWNARDLGIRDPDGLFDNQYPVLYDNVDALFTGQPFSSNHISVANSGDTYNFLASYQQYGQGGVLQPLDGYARNTARLNMGFRPSSQLSIDVSSSYITVDAPSVDEQGQGANYFYSVLTAEPFLDLTERAESGEYATTPTGYGVQGSNFSNPLYVAEQRQFGFNRDRFIGGVTASYELLDWLTLSGRQSLDRGFTRTTDYYPSGFQTPSPSPTLNNGSDERTSSTTSTAISEVWLQSRHSVGTANVSVLGKYLKENRTFDWFLASGNNYVVQGIRDISATDKGSFDIASRREVVRAEDYFLNVDADYQDTYIVSGLVRRDGSSSFGADQRWQTYYRGSLAYRLSEVVEMPKIQELKLRLSYGTSGQRPPFQAQYETFAASASGISPFILGNKDLKPSTVGELEAGVNVAFLDRFLAEVNYARTTVRDDYIDVPLSSAAGFQRQWQNIGEIKASAFEMVLSGPIMRKRAVQWDFGFTFSRVRQEIADLGRIPAFTRSIPGTALPLFRVEAGLPYGTMYGNQLLTSLDQLTSGADGSVLNLGSDVNGDGLLTAADYEINGQGFVVPLNSQGTSAEQPVYEVEASGEKAVVQIGNTQPNFSVGFTTSVARKGFRLYALLDWTSGGDVYNYTKQLLFFNNRHKEAQDLSGEGYDQSYTNASSAVYNGAGASSYFVEKASFVKLREVSLSYSLGGDRLQRLVGNRIQRVNFSVIGRNLLTITDYTGWDPEVALRTNSTNFRVDEYAYPNYRTFTGAIEITF